MIASLRSPSVKVDINRVTKPFIILIIVEIVLIGGSRSRSLVV